MGAWASTFKKGRKSETLCSRYLETIGYSVIKQNWYCRWGEIDIIAKYKTELIFVEVKSVSSLNYCNAVELFNPSKRRKLLKTINYFVFRNARFIKFWRLDLVCLTKDAGKIWIEHYKNVLAL
jgi:putative endonuclease